jgi:hypothetical protein
MELRRFRLKPPWPQSNACPFAKALGIWLASNSPAPAQGPANLTVTKSTSGEVDLSWTGGASSYTVQRSVLGGPFDAIATASTTSYKDTQIDPYTTYLYQITANSANSNQVTVGPPPAGFQLASPVPAQGNPHSYGYGLSMVQDSSDPAFAFLYDDPNQDTDHTDTQLLFRSWNRAKYACAPELM